MHLKMLEPIYDYDSYSQPIAQLIEYELYVNIFKPLYEVFGLKIGEKYRPPKFNSAFWNAIGRELEKALRSGRIVYVDGYFYGEFKAIIGLELRRYGATFDKNRKAYKLFNPPLELKTILVQAKHEVAEQSKLLMKRLEELRNNPLDLEVGPFAGNILKDLSKQFTKTVTPESIEVPMEKNPVLTEALTKGYKSNLDLYINDWKEEQIERLRSQVFENVERGYRADKMVDILESEYGVTRSKAKFLARQETSLLVSRYRQEKYQEAGIGEYIWSTSHDERVRDGHKILDRKKFSWDHPPIVDQSTGRRANPGEDFGCRCLAVPVMRIGG
jgi:SPP1 gp7 family putative phage head morphogenesis protein